MKVRAELLILAAEIVREGVSFTKALVKTVQLVATLND